MKAIFITLFFALSIPLGGFSAEELHADLNVSASVDAESIEAAEQKAKKMLHDELGVKPNDALGDIQTEELE